MAAQALAAVYGGAQSLHTNAFDEALALPTEHAATLALRTQQVLMHEAGTTATVDPLGGSWYVEALTDELEARSRDLIERVDELGGAVAAIETGWIQEQIEESAFRWQREVETGERVIVGVNRFTTDAADRVELHRLDPAIERAQRDRLQALRASARSGRGRGRGRGGPTPCADRGEPAPCTSRGAGGARDGRRAVRGAPRGLGNVRRRPMRR